MNMHHQTEELLKAILLHRTPPHVAGLITAYSPTPPLCYNLFAEPYYGDYTKCCMVLITHNPGQSTVAAKGVGSPFDVAINNPLALARAGNYHNIAVTNTFPNPATNQFVANMNLSMKAIFASVAAFKNNLFIRDLIPYHSQVFGNINMPACTNYLYGYFFDQVITAAMNSELYINMNGGHRKPVIVMFARGKAWTGNLGLTSVGWEFVGKIYSNCYIYKANLSVIKNLEGFEQGEYPSSLFSHDIYIVAFTQVLRGGPIGIYNKKKKPVKPIPLSACNKESEDLYALFQRILAMAQTGVAC